MSTNITKQEIAVSSAPTFKKIIPFIEVKKNGTVITDITNISIDRSLDSLSDSFTITFIGQNHYSDLDPNKSTPVLFQVYTGYSVDGVVYKNLLIEGYPDGRTQRLNSNELTTVSTFYDKGKRLTKPNQGKKIIDVFKEEDLTQQNWSATDGIENFGGIVKASEICSRMLSGTGIGLRYSCYDYSIQDYKNEDYPINIIRDIVEFVGGYIKYNATQNVLECLEKQYTSTGSYDFLYEDAGDIIELSEDTKCIDFINAIQIFGTMKDKRRDEANNLEVTEDENYSGSCNLSDDDALYIIDILNGTEKAPDSPYIEEPPKELIKLKFHNLLLGFEIDPNSIEVEGGSYNEDTGKYEGAEFIAYGNMQTSSEVLDTQGSFEDLAIQSPEFLVPGEGKVGTTWNYEENKGSEGDFSLEEGLYKYNTIKGKVIDTIDKKPIASASVEIDFNGTGQTWQYWRNIDSNATVRFWWNGSPGLDSHWEDVTSEYPSIDAPTGFPRTVVSGNGTEGEEEDSAGVFSFVKCPISQYKVTASALGYNDNDLTITLDEDSFDFLQSTGKDKNKKYKLVDTPYHIVVKGKKLSPLISGIPTDDELDPDETFLDNKNNGIAIDLRYSRGISMAGGYLIYGDKIIDSRVINEDIAKKAGLAVILNSIGEKNTYSFHVPHNPYLQKGMRIGIKSEAKWAGETKVFTCKEINTNYSVSDNNEELYDTLTAVENISQ